MRENPKKQLVGGLLFLAMGAGVALWGCRAIWLANASRSWPTAPGRVVESKLERQRFHTKTPNSHGSRTRIQYEANVLFEYTVQGQTYTSDTLRFGEHSTTDEQHVRDILRRYPPGTEVEVYYNPADPHMATLLPGHVPTTYRTIVIGAIFALVGGVLAALAAIKLRASRG